MAAIFDFQQTQTSDTLQICLSVLADPQNMGIAIGISLLSCIETEEYVIAYVLPVNGGHVWITSHPDVREYQL